MYLRIGTGQSRRWEAVAGTGLQFPGAPAAHPSPSPRFGLLLAAARTQRQRATRESKKKSSPHSAQSGQSQCYSDPSAKPSSTGRRFHSRAPTGLSTFFAAHHKTSSPEVSLPSHQQRRQPVGPFFNHLLPRPTSPSSPLLLLLPPQPFHQSHPSFTLRFTIRYRGCGFHGRTSPT